MDLGAASHFLAKMLAGAERTLIPNAFKAKPRVELTYIQVRSLSHTYSTLANAAFMSRSVTRQHRRATQTSHGLTQTPGLSTHRLQPQAHVPSVALIREALSPSRTRTPLSCAVEPVTQSQAACRKE